MKEEIEKIHRRQVARLLAHLKQAGRYSEELAADIKRSFGYIFEDIKEALRCNACKCKDEKEEEK